MTQCANKVIFFLLLTTLIISCSTTRNIAESDYNFKAKSGIPDYGNLDYWAAHPWKHDTSDSLPASLKKNYHPDSTADIFFIYPTSYTDRTMPFGYNAPIDDSAINHKTDYSSILYQASIFNEAGRVFAPRYRQANYFVYFPTDTAAAVAALNKAYEDIKAAFEYYLKHYNNGRPIIIAAHSQGTTHAKRLMKEFFDGKPLQNKLVVAYLIGMPVEPGYFSSIPACTKPDQTGCICSWRTFKKGYVHPLVGKEKFTAIVTNPLTWDSSKPLASRSENKGAVLLKFSKVLLHVASAQVHEGVLWTKKPHFFGNVFYRSGNYHIADYNLYYMNVRENVKERINAFWKR
jgi:hypothetical protein